MNPTIRFRNCWDDRTIKWNKSKLTSPTTQIPRQCKIKKSSIWEIRSTTSTAKWISWSRRLKSSWLSKKEWRKTSKTSIAISLRTRNVANPCPKNWWNSTPENSNWPATKTCVRLVPTFSMWMWIAPTILQLKMSAEKYSFLDTNKKLSHWIHILIKIYIQSEV